MPDETPILTGHGLNHIEVTKPLVAPWDAETVEALNRHQGDHNRHPFTCPADGTRGSKQHSDRRILTATPEGWVCDFNDCGYTQDWAHFHMTQKDA